MKSSKLKFKHSVTFLVQKKRKRASLKMQPGLIDDNFWDYFCSLVVDVLIFVFKSIYFMAETVFLTILPDRFRKMKVSSQRWNICVANCKSNKHIQKESRKVVKCGDLKTHFSCLLTFKSIERKQKICVRFLMSLRNA